MHHPLSWCRGFCPLAFFSSHPPTTMTMTAGETAQTAQHDFSWCHNHLEKWYPLFFFSPLSIASLERGSRLFGTAVFFSYCKRSTASSFFLRFRGSLYQPIGARGKLFQFSIHKTILAASWLLWLHTDGHIVPKGNKPIHPMNKCAHGAFWGSLRKDNEKPFVWRIHCSSIVWGHVCLCVHTIWYGDERR